MEPVARWIGSVTFRISRHARQRAARFVRYFGLRAQPQRHRLVGGAFGPCPACWQTNARSSAFRKSLLLPKARDVTYRQNRPGGRGDRGAAASIVRPFLPLRLARALGRFRLAGGDAFAFRRWRELRLLGRELGPFVVGLRCVAANRSSQRHSRVIRSRSRGDSPPCISLSGTSLKSLGIRRRPSRNSRQPMQR
jgi:hypothetical protein